MYGPHQFILVGLQIIGVVFIGINYCINNYTNGNESFLYYKENEKYYHYMYLFFGIISIVLLLLTIIIIIVRKQKGQLYNTLNEIKN